MKKILFALAVALILFGAFCLHQYQVNNVAEAMGGTPLPNLGGHIDRAK